MTLSFTVQAHSNTHFSSWSFSLQRCFSKRQGAHTKHLHCLFCFVLCFLEGHILISEICNSTLISLHIYKWCKRNTVVFVIQNNHLSYGKTILHIHIVYFPNNSQNENELQNHQKKQGKLLQFKLFPRKIVLKHKGDLKTASWYSYLRISFPMQ